MLKYCDSAHSIIALSDDGGHSVVIVERGNPRFAELAAIGPTKFVAPSPPEPTTEDYRRAIDAHVETTARARDYNGAAHMASYVSSTVPAWRAEAETFVAWRDAVWLAAFEMMATLTAPPSVEDVIAALPDVEWPS